MPMYTEILKTLKEVVESSGQSKDVTTRITRWLNDLSEGKVSLEDKDDIKRRIETIVNAVMLNNDKMEEI